MSKLLYPKLALINIGKHSKLYFPYIISACITAAMFCVMCEITMNEDLTHLPGGDKLPIVLGMGDFVIALFSLIFLIYTNSFLMKQRRRELGLYNVLGMEKKHISAIMFFEMLFVSAISVTAGLLFGLLFNKLISLALCKLLSFEVKLAFGISPASAIITALLFFGIFFICYISNVIKVRRSSTVELLHSVSFGEREPRAKVLLAVLGVALLVTGYVIALTVKSPLEALTLFFIAVVAVIVGTYLLFMSGSIAVLKLLRKNKKFYYTPKHFNSVSGMIYRMKQNAVGLANICILSTMVLVMVSTTASMYLGLEDALGHAYPTDMRVAVQYSDEDYVYTPESAAKVEQALLDTTADTVSSCSLEMKNLSVCEYFCFASLLNGDTFETRGVNYSSNSSYIDAASIHELFIVSLDDYNDFTGESATLGKNEVLIYSTGAEIGDSFELLDERYTVKQQLDGFLTIGGSSAISSYTSFSKNLHYIVVNDKQTMSHILNSQKDIYGEFASNMRCDICFNLDGTAQQEIACAEQLYESIKETKKGFDFNCVADVESREMGRTDFCSAYGSFLFLGIVLGVLFLMVTVMIIYYKQISEGYDDKRRFVIMKQVGMSDAEVRSSVRSQILTVFFLPLVTAFVHLAFAFPIISELMKLFHFSNISVFAAGLAVVAALFAAIYAAVYTVTARTYYKIVS